MPREVPGVLLPAVLLFLALVPQRAHAQFVTSNPILEMLTNAQLAEDLAQTGTLTNQLLQLEQVLSTSQEQLGLMRDVYDGVNAFTSFDPDQFLAEGSAYFRSQVPGGGLTSRTQSFISDVRANGLRGGDFSRLRARYDTYRDSARALEAAQASPERPYDARAALSLSESLQASLATPEARKGLLTAPTPSTVTEGLIASDLARADPTLLRNYLQRRAQAREAEDQALDLLCESMGCQGAPAPSVGKAQQLTAQASAQSAVELTRLNGTASDQLALDQLRRQEEAAAAARARAEHDALWKNIGQSLKAGMAPTELPKMPVAPLQ
jgi:hypothetical protein